MLCEIFCDKFLSNGKVREPIIFQKGLNIIQGQNSGANSIGKSTFLLVIDFAFGGETYAQKETIINKIGHHKIDFCFEFDNKKHYFSRNTETPKLVSECNSEYKSSKNPIGIEEFRKFLLKFYNINLASISFRQILGSYFRIYGKSNFDEKMPLASYSGESQENSLISLLKLYNSYDVMIEFNNNIEDKKKYKNSIISATKYNLINIITKKKLYLDNLKQIGELQEKLTQLTKHGRDELLNNDSTQIEIGSELKAQFDSCNRKKRQLWAKYYSIKEMNDIKRPSTTQDFNELLKYFPNSNLDLLNNIENFHSKLTDILQEEFSDAMSNTLKEINDLSQEMTQIENSMQELDIPLHISEKTLKSYAQIQNQINELEKANELYLKKKEIEDEIKTLKQSYEKLFIEQATPVCSKINVEIKKLNTYIYGEEIESPLLNIFKPNSYSFKTPSDDGTGTNNKNLILLDLATLNLTQLPAISHDTIIFKHIAQEPMGKIIELYNQYDKQIFIAIDESNKYPIEAQKIVDEKKVITLSGNGNELYGWSWNKKEKENKNEDNL